MASEHLLFEEARIFVVLKGFKSQKDFYSWRERPAFIPSNPPKAYGQRWEGWAYWLGTGPKNPRKPGRQVTYLSFTEARALAREVAARLEMKQYTDWVRWAKTDERPANIPADPRHVYLNSGWSGWPDWLGRKSSAASVAKQVRCFPDARAYARSLGLGGSKAWFKWAATDSRPLDIPYSPDKRYRDEGWIGWGDFLGFSGAWNHLSIVAFLDSLKPIIQDLSEFDLYLILSRNGMLARDRRQLGAKLLRGLTKLKRPTDIDQAKEQLAKEMEGDQVGAADEDDVDVEELPAVDESQLRPLQLLNDLRAVDAVAAARITDDPEILEFMVLERVSALWVKAMEEGIDAAQACIPTADGPYLKLIRQRFETELQAVQCISLPEGYAFQDDDGNLREPNLMQRLTAWRLLKDRRLGNWSGVGSGKTVAAILSAGVIKAKVTVIVAANATLPGWKEAILKVFPSGTSVCVGRRDFELRSGARNFLIVNYESFQQEWSETFIRSLLAGLTIDMIVLDEVHFVRQRYEGEPRMRRRLLESLISGAITANPQALHPGDGGNARGK